MDIREQFYTGPRNARGKPLYNERYVIERKEQDTWEAIGLPYETRSVAEADFTAMKEEPGQLRIVNERLYNGRWRAEMVLKIRVS